MKSIDALIAGFKEFREELVKSAEAGPKAKALISDRPISPKEVSDVGPASFKIEPKRGQKVKQIDIPQVKKGEEKLSLAKNGQWMLHAGER